MSEGATIHNLFCEQTGTFANTALSHAVMIFYNLDQHFIYKNTPTEQKTKLPQKQKTQLLLLPRQVTSQRPQNLTKKLCSSANSLHLPSPQFLSEHIF